MSRGNFWQLLVRRGPKFGASPSFSNFLIILLGTVRFAHEVPSLHFPQRGRKRRQLELSLRGRLSRLPTLSFPHSFCETESITKLCLASLVWSRPVVERAEKMGGDHRSCSAIPTSPPETSKEKLDGDSSLGRCDGPLVRQSWPKPLSAAIVVVLRVRSRTGPSVQNRRRPALGVVCPDPGKRTPFHRHLPSDERHHESSYVYLCCRCSVVGLGTIAAPVARGRRGLKTF
ncbi:uncharacterized protein B0H64DRAFT_408236 [Chaetomium fimeti]|uniref:Uncharacterized protein n=1 Tax=Chaetomium fimeti TaxID=1854472 RepID=A0AAE0LP54_9PEZI|nr:hypothetical protein B0H64DRAFT_408236 [Chaetomium fimeti]